MTGTDTTGTVLDRPAGGRGGPLDAADRRPPWWRRISVKQYGLGVALVAVVLFFQAATGGRLLLAGNINNLIQQNAYVLILAIGMVMVIVAGHIDLSVGSVVGFVGAVAALAVKDWGIPWWGAILLALVVGALVGAWQGFWVAFVGIPAFIVTLAGMLVFRGLALVLLTDGTVSDLPDELTFLGAGWLQGPLGAVGGLDVLTLLFGVLAAAGALTASVSRRRRLLRMGLPAGGTGAFALRLGAVVVLLLGLAVVLAGYRGTPVTLLVVAALVVAAGFVMSRTVFGRGIYAVGGNRAAAAMSGIDTRRVDFGVFVTMGVLAALAALVVTARSGSAVSSAGTGYELDAIAAVFIGGAAVSGGIGRVSGAVIGALFMGVLNMGLSVLSVDTAWQQAIKGVVLLLAVAFDIAAKRRGTR